LFFNMLRYLPGILLVQVVTAILLWVNLDATPRDLAIQFGVPAILITLVTGLWFASIARADAERANAKIRLQHAREREKIQVTAEKNKARLVEQTQKQIRKEERRVNRKAGFKVSLAFIGASAVGVLMLIIELFTFGLMTIMTTVGGMGGYLIRARQTHDANKPSIDDSSKVIDVIEHVPEPSTPQKRLPERSK